MSRRLSKPSILALCAAWLLAMPSNEAAAQAPGQSRAPVQVQAPRHSQRPTQPQGLRQPQKPRQSGVSEVEVQGENTRQAPEPLISFIDSPGATCYQQLVPGQKQSVCYINWYFQYVDAAPNYMVFMETTINTLGMVARTHGFFQTSMYIPGTMYGPGFAVPCGARGSGGNPDLGMAYSWTIRARDSANLNSANYGTVYCPAEFGVPFPGLDPEK